MYSTDINEFQQILKQAKSLTMLTGAGVSAESGVPTFRGAGGLWRNFPAHELSSPQTWNRDPGLMWEFFNYRRQVMHDKKPNPGHFAIAEIEKQFENEGKKFSLITQNIDDLHFVAGSKNVTRLHGSLWLVRCISCNHVCENKDVPITPAYANSGAPDLDPNKAKKFSEGDLPKCVGCGGIVRPHVVWFGEPLDYGDISSAQNATHCDVFIVVGTSSVVYPAAGLSVQAKHNGAKVAVVNLEESPADSIAQFVFLGKSGELLHKVLGL